MSALNPHGIESLVKGPAGVLLATLHDLIDVEGQMGKLERLSDAILRAKALVQKDKKYDSALNLQQLQKQRDVLRLTLPRVRLIK